MILTGKEAIEKYSIVSNLIDEKEQVQACGIDFTLKKISSWKSAGTLDFDNSKRRLPEYEQIELIDDKVFLKKGAYIVEFNETVAMPLNVMGTLQTRSSAFRSGVLLTAGVLDPGYQGAVGAVLQVLNEYGINLYRNAKLVQWVFATLTEDTPHPYKGVYQNAQGVV